MYTNFTDMQYMNITVKVVQWRPEKSNRALYFGKEGVSLYKFIFRNWASPAIEIGPFSTLHKPDYEASCKLHLSCVMARLLYASFYNASFHIAFFSQTAFFILCFW